MKKLFHILDLDKRKRKRVELFSNLPGELSTLGRKTNIQIKDVSYGGIGVVLPSDHEFEIIESMEAQVEIFGQVFRGNIANQILLSSEQKKVGFKLPEEGSSQISFSTQDPTWDRVADPETVSSIYQDLILKGYQSPMEIRQNFSRAIVYPRQMLESGAMICEIKEVYQGSLERGRVQCMFELFQTHHAFEGNLERVDATQAQIRLPVVLARLLRRETVRIPKKQAKYDVKLKLSSQAFATKIESYEVFDYSEHGISILDPKGELSLPRNLVFNQAKIEIEGMEEIQGKAEVRSYQWKRDLNAYVVGLKFEPDGEPHLTRWHNLVLKARYPSLDFDYQEKDHQKIWELFERSGYVGLSASGEFSHAFDVSKHTWKKLHNAGTGVSRRILIVDKDQVLGHLQMDRIYPNTWSAHQLAIDPSKSKIVGREIYSVTADVLKAESSKYFISITDVAKPWNKRSYYDFIETYPYFGHNEVKHYQVYEGKTDHPNEIKIPDSYNVSIAQKYDLKTIARYFEVNSSDLEIKACSLDTENLRLEKLNESYEKYGLNRKREFLILKQGDRRVGFSRMEFGTEATNIFGLLDLLYIYIFDEFKNESNFAHDVLIAESLKFYKENGRKDVIIYLNDSRKEHYISKGLTYIWDGVRWIATIDIVSRYYAYVQNLYGHLLLKREKTQKK